MDLLGWEMISCIERGRKFEGCVITRLIVGGNRLNVEAEAGVRD